MMYSKDISKEHGELLSQIYTKYDDVRYQPNRVLKEEKMIIDLELLELDLKMKVIKDKIIFFQTTSPYII